MTYTVKNTETTIGGRLSQKRTVHVWQVINPDGEILWKYLQTEEQARNMAEALNSKDAAKIRDAEERIRYGRVLTESERIANAS